MASQPNLSLNQFSQQPILGQLALSLGSPPLVIQAVVSATGSPTLYAAQAIQFDSTITSTPSGVPPIVAASGTQYADGYILYDVKNNGGWTSANVVQVVLQGVLWMLAESTVDVGQVVQDGADVGGVAAFATTSYDPRGISLDYGTVGQLIRVMLFPASNKAAQAAAHT